jgi:hypothetical protein
MDTDETESEIDDGEEEERVKRRRRRSVLRAPTHQETVPTAQMDPPVDIERKKKSTIELKLPQTLDRPRVCYVKQEIPFEIFGICLDRS